MRWKKWLRWLIPLAILLAGLVGILSQNKIHLTAALPQEKQYIKWVEFGVPAQALRDAMALDIKTHEEPNPLPWIDSLAYLASRNGGNWKNYRSSQMQDFVEKRKNNSLEELTAESDYFSFYQKAYTAVLGGMLGEYEKETPPGPDGKKQVKKFYGLKAYCPIAEGFSYSHYDDFGAGRSYGYKRTHMGNDLMGNVGTPIVAIEGGTVEAIGWNDYGGWRMGIRSFDGKRSYYYAHLRKGHPYAKGLQIGTQVKAGQVIGYLGMTGYSSKEDTNGMNVPHLHLGMQLIFDESQKEGINQIWIDMYQLVELLSQNKATVQRVEEEKESIRTYDIYDPLYPPALQKKPVE